MKRASLWRGAALLLACLLLSSCVHMTFEPTSAQPHVPLPTPDLSSVEAPVGDSRARYGARATLYYITQEGVLSPALRLVYVDAEDNELTQILRSLLEPPYASSGLLPIAPEGTSLRTAALQCGVLTVDLSAEALSQGEDAFFATRAALARTMLGRQGVQAVNVLVEGRACEYGGLSMGALTAQQPDVAAALAQLRAEQLLLQSEGTFVERTAVVYRPDPYSGRLLPQPVSVRLTADDPVSPVLQAFVTAVAGDVWPKELLNQVQAQVSVTNAGERLLTLQLPGALFSAQGLLAPAVACTIGAFVPQIDAVRVFVEGQIAPVVGDLQTDEAGLVSPQRLRSPAATTAMLYFVDGQGRLQGHETAISGEALSPRALLSALLEVPAARPDLHSALPPGIQPADFLGVRVEEGIACVNLSSAFYAACQRLDPQAEQAVVYAMVNTIVENLPTVTAVQCMVAGCVPDTLSGTLSLIAPLMASPGLAAQQEPNRP